jgi:hypothetical protein
VRPLRCKASTTLQLSCLLENKLAIQGYHVVKTEDIPSVAGATEAASACMSTAAAILQLLKATCKTDGASYVLQKDRASQAVRLFELSSPGTDEHQPDKTPADQALCPSDHEVLRNAGGACRGTECSGSATTREGHAAVSEPHSAHTPVDEAGNTASVQCQSAMCSPDMGSQGLAPASIPAVDAPGTPAANDIGALRPVPGMMKDADGPLHVREHVAQQQSTSLSADGGLVLSELSPVRKRSLQSPYAHRIAQLCYRMATRVLEPTKETTDGGVVADAALAQAERLLQRCVKLTDASENPELVAAALLQLAEARMGQIRVAGREGAEPGLALALSMSAQRTRIDTAAAQGGAVLLSVVPDACSGQAGAREMPSRQFAVVAKDLSMALLTLHRHAPGSCLPLWQTLKSKLFRVYARMAEQFLIHRHPGAALRCIMMAACHLEVSKKRGGEAEDRLLRLLHCTAIAHFAMVRRCSYPPCLCVQCCGLCFCLCSVSMSVLPLPF